MHYVCRYCDFELDEPHMSKDIMQNIFEHEKTHPENRKIYE